MSLHERQGAMRERMASERKPVVETAASGHECGHESKSTAQKPKPGLDSTAFKKSAPDIRTGAPAPRLLDLRAAGAYMGVSYWTMRDLALAGIVPTVKLPCPRAKDGRVIRRVLIDRQDLDRLIEANKEMEQ